MVRVVYLLVIALHLSLANGAVQAAGVAKPTTHPDGLYLPPELVMSGLVGMCLLAPLVQARVWRRMGASPSRQLVAAVVYGADALYLFLVTRYLFLTWSLSAVDPLLSSTEDVTISDPFALDHHQVGNATESFCLQPDYIVPHTNDVPAPGTAAIGADLLRRVVSLGSANTAAYVLLPGYYEWQRVQGALQDEWVTTAPALVARWWFNGVLALPKALWWLVSSIPGWLWLLVRSIAVWSWHITTRLVLGVWWIVSSAPRWLVGLLLSVPGQLLNGLLYCVTSIPQLLVGLARSIWALPMSLWGLIVSIPSYLQSVFFWFFVTWNLLTVLGSMVFVFLLFLLIGVFSRAGLLLFVAAPFVWWYSLGSLPYIGLAMIAIARSIFMGPFVIRHLLMPFTSGALASSPGSGRITPLWWYLRLLEWGLLSACVAVTGLLERLGWKSTHTIPSFFALDAVGSDYCSEARLALALWGCTVAVEYAWRRPELGQRSLSVRSVFDASKAALKHAGCAMPGFPPPIILLAFLGCVVSLIVAPTARLMQCTSSQLVVWWAEAVSPSDGMRASLGDMDYHLDAGWYTSWLSVLHMFGAVAQTYVPILFGYHLLALLRFDRLLTSRTLRWSDSILVPLLTMMSCWISSSLRALPSLKPLTVLLASTSVWFAAFVDLLSLDSVTMDAAPAWLVPLHLAWQAALRLTVCEWLRWLWTWLPPTFCLGTKPALTAVLFLIPLQFEFFMTLLNVYNRLTLWCPFWCTADGTRPPIVRVLGLCGMLNLKRVGNVVKTGATVGCLLVSTVFFAHLLELSGGFTAYRWVVLVLDSALLAWKLVAAVKHQFNALKAGWQIIQSFSRPTPSQVDNEDCPICYSAMTVHSSVLTACGHVFHEDCVAQWVVSSNQCTCPVCKQALKWETQDLHREQVPTRPADSAPSASSNPFLRWARSTYNTSAATNGVSPVAPQQPSVPDMGLQPAPPSPAAPQDTQVYVVETPRAAISTPHATPIATVSAPLAESVSSVKLASQHDH